MIKAYRLYTGSDGHSHVEHGHIIDHDIVKAGTVQFQESEPHASLDWHQAPTMQYVITLSGILEFITHGGESFTIVPGDVLIAMDTTGSGHQWKLINDEPWRRVYVTFGEGVKASFASDDRS